MSAAYIAIAVISSLLLAVSGIRKLRRAPYIVRSIRDAARVPIRWFPVLAALEFAAAAGLLAGIVSPPLGIAAAAGMALYFVGAIVAHLRVHDAKGSWPAVQMLSFALTALVTRTLSR